MKLFLLALSTSAAIVTAASLSVEEAMEARIAEGTTTIEQAIEHQKKGTFSSDKTFCWRDSYGRGVGYIPQKCKPDEDRIGLLCYPKCHRYNYRTAQGHMVTFSRWGFDCHQNCPSGFANQGLYCRKTEYGRGAGRSPCTGCTGCSWGGCSGCSDCSTSRCHGHEEGWGLLCYPKCRAGYSNFACCICRPSVTCSHYGFNHQFDLSCAKSIKIGAVRTGQCNGDDEMDVGLCYPRCRAGYDGVGPVCWGKAPIVNGQPFEICGMGAAKDGTTCGIVLADQISSPFMIVANLVSAGALGKVGKGIQKAGAAVAKAASKVGSGIAKVGGKIGSGIARGAKWAKTKVVGVGKNAKKLDEVSDAGKGIASVSKLQSVKDGLSKAAKACQQKIGLGTKACSSLNHARSALTTAATKTNEVDQARAVIQAIGMVDPTGVADCAAAYMYPKCTAAGYASGWAN